MLHVNQLTGFGAGGSRTPLETLTYITSGSNDSTAGTTYTFSGVSLGTAYEGRRIIVCYSGSEAGHDLTAVTVGGVSASQLAEFSFSSGNHRNEIWMATVPTGTTGDIVLTSSAATGWAKVIDVYSLDSAKTTVVDSGTDDTSTFTFTRTFVAGEFYIGVGRTASTNTETWTNATEDSATTVTGRTRVSSASYGPAASGSRTITYTPSSTGGSALLSVVIG